MSRPPVEAVLQAGDTETLYRRAGDGPPVLVLSSGARAEPVGGRLFERLAKHARVILAAVPPGAAATDVLAEWLGDVTEGLGLVRPTLVLDAALAAELLEDDAPEAFAGVVVVGGDEAETITELVRAAL